jgi:phospholipase C
VWQAAEKFATAGEKQMTLDRRDFVKGAIGASGVALLGGKLGSSGLTSAVWRDARHSGLPDPHHSGIEHVVVVMMENRSFDHILGWLPGADGRQAGLAYVGPDGKKHKTHHETQLNGCGFADPDHSYSGGRIQYAGGRMNGFLTDTNNDEFAISYYKATDRPFMGRLARHYATCDRYFCSILGPTFPNRIFQHAGQTDRLTNTFNASQLPAIWDRLNHPGGPTGRYYYSDLPITALWGQKFLPISAKLDQFMTDAAAGTLPNVSYVDPSFIGEGNATANDDHPACDLRAGDSFLSQIFHAVSNGPGWKHTVLIINYDEWGGFYEHVAPHRVTAGVPIGASPAVGLDHDFDARKRVLTGFRVPCIIASPFTRRREGASVTHGFYDHTSVLKLIEWRWGLAPLSRRDASNAPFDPGNLAHALNFRFPDARVPKLPVLAPFVPTACAPAAATVKPLVAAGARTAAVAVDPGREDWIGLQQSGLLDGWPAG